MPDDTNGADKPELTPTDNSEAELKSSAFDSSPLPGPVPEVEQEPQTSASTPGTTAETEQPVSSEPSNAFTAQPVSSDVSNDKKKWVIGSIVVVLLIVIVAVAALTYFVY